ncbi:MAG: hypothetical protein K6T51_01925 [Rubrobacteraceae bacterium]|nr:hypothetical protein [Rubrobacteraceae bacterium]
MKRRRVATFFSVAAVLLVVGGGAFAGYNYYMYRTLWGDPNVNHGASGTVQTHYFYSRALGETVRYLIYLPPGYGALQNHFEHYPVVYLLHGSPGRPEDWVNVGGIKDKMDTLISEGKVRPMIVVMPQGNPSQFSPSSEYVNGAEGDWATYITRDLVRQIDEHYRTVDGPGGRAIAGLSEGGFGAANLGLKHRGEYGVIGSFSGYFKMFPNDARRLFGHRARVEARRNSPMDYLNHLKGKLPAFYLYAGRSDGVFLRQTGRFAHELERRHADLSFHVYSGGHSWALWRAHLSSFLIFASRHLE